MPQLPDANVNELVATLRQYWLPRLAQDKHHAGIWNESKQKWDYPTVRGHRPSDDELRDHVLGKHPLSVFLDSPGNDDCKLAVVDVDVDVDNDDVRRYVRAVVEAIRSLHFKPLVSRSTGGSGYHVTCWWKQAHPKLYVLGSLKTAIMKAGTVPAGVAVEYFPKRAFADDAKNTRGITLPFYDGNPALDDQFRPLTTAFIWPKSAPPDEIPDPDTVEQELEPDPDIEVTFVSDTTLVSALEAISADDYDTWIAVGMALKAMFASEPDNGFAIFDRFSQRSVQYKAEEVRKKWDSFKPQRTGIGAIFKAARAAGWQQPEGQAFRSTDLSMSLLCARRTPDLHRFVDKPTEWRHFNGLIWIPDDSNIAVRQMIETNTAYLRQYAVQRLRKGQQVEEMTRLLRYATSLENDRNRTAVANYMQTVTPFPVKIELFDRNMKLLLFADGTLLDTESFEVRPVEPTDLITQHLAVPYIECGDCPMFDAFMLNLLPGEAERECALHLLGLAIAGYGGKLKFFAYFIGKSGDEGKSVLFKLLEALMPQSTHFFGQRDLVAVKWLNDTGLTPQVAKLRAKRLAILPETTENQRLDTGLFKSLTGTDKISGRDIRTKGVSFRSTHLLCGFGNAEIQIVDADDATWKRVLRFECPNTVPDEKRIDEYELVLAREEGAAIVAALLARVRERGQKPTIPESIRKRTEEYRQNQEWWPDFKEQHLERGTDLDFATAADVHARVLTYYQDRFDSPCPLTSIWSFTSYVRLRDPFLNLQKHDGDREARLYGWKLRREAF